jgi:hypothetical protein
MERDAYCLFFKGRWFNEGELLPTEGASVNRESFFFCCQVSSKPYDLLEVTTRTGLFPVVEIDDGQNILGGVFVGGTDVEGRI